MAREQPDWQAFEELVARIQRGLSPGAQVAWTERILGRSGVVRQVDVTVRQSVGVYPVLVAFDCKRHTRKVGLSYVAAFADQAADVGANLAVLISNTGFTSGARRIAGVHGVRLQTLRQAESADWLRLVGPEAWTSILGVVARGTEFSLGLKGDQRLDACMETVLLDSSHTTVETIGDLFWREWGALANNRRVGRVGFEVIPAPGQVLVESGDGFEEVDEIHVSAEIVATRWVVHLELSEGHVLQSDSGEPSYQEFTSSSFDWQQVMDSQPGEELSPDEFTALMSKGQMSMDLAGVHRFVRVRLQLRSGTKESKAV